MDSSFTLHFCNLITTFAHKLTTALIIVVVCVNNNVTITIKRFEYFLTYVNIGFMIIFIEMVIDFTDKFFSCLIYSCGFAKMQVGYITMLHKLSANSQDRKKSSTKRRFIVENIVT